MVTLASNNMTIEDAVRRMDANGNLIPIGELLNQRNGIITDIPWREGDTVGGHMISQRTSLPQIQTVTIGQGVVPSASSTAQILEAPEILAGWQNMDQYVANYGGDAAGKRASEDVAFVEQFDQTVARRFIYGNGLTTVGQMNGLAVRYGALTGTSAQTATNIVDCGGTGSINMSAWLIGWGPRTFYGWYPKGSPGGLYRKDWGMMPRTNPDGTEQVVYRTEYSWHIGCALEDWRFVSRGANIDRAALTTQSAAAPDLFTKFINMINVIFDINMCRPSFYINRTTRMMLDIQARNDVLSGGQLKYDVVDGKRMEFFQNIPITLMDQLTQTEPRIV